MDGDFAVDRADCLAEGWFGGFVAEAFEDLFGGIRADIPPIKEIVGARVTRAKHHFLSNLRAIPVRNDYVLGNAGDRSNSANRVFEVQQNAAQKSVVERSNVNWNVIHVSIQHVHPRLELLVEIPKPAFHALNAFGAVWPVGQHVERVFVGLVEGDYICQFSLEVKGVETGCGPNVQHALASKVLVAGVFLDNVPQIPFALDNRMIRQFGCMIDEAIVQRIDWPRVFVLGHFYINFSSRPSDL